MSTTTTNLQELINQKAEARLKHDLYKLSALISQNRLLNGPPSSTWSTLPNVFFPIVEDVTAIEIEIDNVKQKVYKAANFQQSQFYGSLSVIQSRHEVRGVYAKILYDAWLPYYKEEETKNFLEKVDSLQEQIADLKSATDYDE